MTEIVTESVLVKLEVIVINMTAFLSMAMRKSVPQFVFGKALGLYEKFHCNL